MFFDTRTTARVNICLKILFFVLFALPGVVRAMCRVLRVHFSGFYAWLKEPLSHRAQEDVRQTELIRQAWAESGKVYSETWQSLCNSCRP